MIRTCTIFFMAVLLSCCLQAQTASSASFRLDSASFAAAAGRSSSAAFTVDGLLGFAWPVGASSSASYLSQGGPLSYLGTGQVPMLLGTRMTWTPDPTVRLDWSGNAAGFTVYRSTDCTTVNASPVTTQMQSSYLDPAVAGETLVCYLVQ